MNLQVLLSTMNQSDHSIIDNVNIKTDAIVVNQCDRNEIEEFIHNGRTIKFLSFAERGVGVSRNNALMRATGDICLFADDDVVYEDNYEEKVINAFMKNPKADVILFNMLSTDKDRESSKITKQHKVGYTNCLRYGTVRIAVKTERVHMANIFFSLMFGGGARYSAGEDCLFLTDCIKKGLRVYAVPEVIGSITEGSSTWFNGFTDKYFFDKGVLYTCLSKPLAYLLCIRFAIMRHWLYKKDKTIKQACISMFKGVKSIKNWEKNNDTANI